MSSFLLKVSVLFGILCEGQINNIVVADISSEKFDSELKEVARLSSRSDAFAFLRLGLRSFQKIVQEDCSFVREMLELDDWIEEEA
jgi:hypothetical protein